MMRAADVMTRKLVTVAPDAAVGDAVRLMLDKHVSGLPVTDGAGKLVGVLTEGDLLRRVEIGTEGHSSRLMALLRGTGRLADDYVRTHARLVSEIMSTEPKTVDPDASLDDIVRLMQKHRIKRVPVVEGGALIGVVSRADILRALLPELPEDEHEVLSDADMRRRILAELEGQPWAPLMSVDIVVSDGGVALCGVITDERERRALHVAVERVPGVKSIHDHLCWIDPVSGSVIEAASDPGSRRVVPTTL
jgi:CBS domain-containing protein